MDEKQTEETTIHKLHQIVHKRLIRFIKNELKPYDFNRGEIPLLYKLLKEGDGKTQTEICDMLHVSKSTTCKIIQNLVVKGFLRKERDEYDKRVTKIFLTDRKDEIKDLLMELDEKAENKMLEGFDDEEKERLRDYLERIFNNLERSK